MSRFLPLLIFIVWKSFDAVHGDGADASQFSVAASLFYFLAPYVLIIAFMGLWSRRLASRLTDDNLQASLRRFTRIIEAARFAICGWFAYAVFALGWPRVVAMMLGPVSTLPIELPSVLIGVAPPFLAWIALWWAQFPADRAMREQSALIHLDHAMPVHAPPSFRSYLEANLRMQLLFISVPILLVLCVHDFLSLLLISVLGLHSHADVIDALISLPAVGAIMLVAPEVLRRIVPTVSLPAGHLRNKLTGICESYRLRYRGILLWKTQNNVANALVMGLIPRFRYILLSDLLLETMTDEQIEAVFAHEVGHVRHRHMMWYMVFFIAFVFVSMGPGTSLEGALGHIGITGDTASTIADLVVGIASFALVFGFVMRRFERQADVFAARAIQSRHPMNAVYGAVTPAHAAAAPTASFAGANLAAAAFVDGADMNLFTAAPQPAPAAPALAGTPIQLTIPSTPDLRRAPVGAYGAAVFASALRQVAIVNNIPIAARSWCHGSIASRIGFLNRLGADPARTADFDRHMARINISIICALCAALAWTIAIVVRGG